MYGREASETFLPPRELLPGLVAALAVVALAADSGGYGATSWGWSGAALLLVAAAALARGGRRPARLESALLASLALLTAWTWLSLAWSADVSQTVREGQRLLLYVAAAAALVLLGRGSRPPRPRPQRTRPGSDPGHGRSGHVRALTPDMAATESARRRTLRSLGVVVGVAAAITGVCAYALVLRLLDPGSGAYQVGSSDPQAGLRLARPLGYANGLAIFAVLGILLALGLAVRGRSAAARALSSAALVVLAPTLYFTYGRGAWLALAAGLVALLIAERERLDVLWRLLALALAPTAAVLLASNARAVTSDPASLAAAAHDGRRLAVALALLAVAAAFVPAVLERTAPGPTARRLLGAVLALLVVAAAAVALVRVGGPAGAIRRAHDAFDAPAPLVQDDASARLFSLSGSNRSDYWRVAWREWEDHPLLGGGAGSFQRFWLRHRAQNLPVRDAHSLYLETLAELGPAGLALLLCALAIPLVAAARREGAVAAGALGAYAAYLAHAGIDWDWELPAVTVAALACGISLLPASSGTERRPLGRGPRLAAATAAVALACISLVGLAGSRAELASADALDAERLQVAADEARRAQRWEPWSAEPWRLLGEAQLHAGDVDRARTSFLRGLSKDSGDWELWLDLALVSRGEERRAALGRVSKLNPLSAELRQLAAAS